MVRYSSLFFLLLIPFLANSEESKAATLQELLEQVKNSRKSDVISPLPDGIHWVEGYYFSGYFYPCSEKNGLYFADGPEKSRLNELASTLMHVEMTVDKNSGRIDILEIHNLIEGAKLGCTYRGKK